jgi:hypothetical protein
MKNYETIVTLLQKKILTNEEQNLLDSLINDDKESRDFYETYKKTAAVVNASSHPSIDELSNYILFKNGLEKENLQTVKHAPLIELHLRSCKKCAEEFKLLNTEFTEVDSYVSGRFIPSVKEEKFPEVPPFTSARGKFTSRFYAFASVILIGAVYAALFFYSSISTPSYYQYAELKDKSEFYITRGRATDEFQESIKALEEEDYKSAIRHLQNDIEKNSSDNTIFYSYYILGLTYLETAENNFLGLFKSFDKTAAQKGLNSLLIAVEKNNSGKFQNITLDAYYYAAKAGLMTDDVKHAKEYLNKVIEGKGSKMAQAKNILSQLE